MVISFLPKIFALELTQREKEEAVKASTQYPTGYIASVVESSTVPPTFLYTSLFPLHPYTPFHGFVQTNEERTGDKIICERPFFLRGQSERPYSRWSITVYGTQSQVQCDELRHDFFRDQVRDGKLDMMNFPVFSDTGRELSYVGRIQTLSVTQRHAMRTHNFVTCLYAVNGNDRVAAIIGNTDNARCSHLFA